MDLTDEQIDRAIHSLSEDGYSIQTWVQIRDFFPEEKVDSDDPNYGDRMRRFHIAEQEAQDRARDAVRKAIRIALGGEE